MARPLSQEEFLDLITYLSSRRSVYNSTASDLHCFLTHRVDLSKRIKVDRPLSQIIEDGEGLLQFRQYESQKELYVGNLRRDVGSTEWKKIVLPSDSYTIHPDLRTCPSLMGTLGERDLSKFFPKGCFEKIVIGVQDPMEITWLYENLKWLLKNNGWIHFTWGFARLVMMRMYDGKLQTRREHSQDEYDTLSAEDFDMWFARIHVPQYTRLELIRDAEYKLSSQKEYKKLLGELWFKSMTTQAWKWRGTSNNEAQVVMDMIESDTLILFDRRDRFAEELPLVEETIKTPQFSGEVLLLLSVLASVMSAVIWFL